MICLRPTPVSFSNFCSPPNLRHQPPKHHQTTQKSCPTSLKMQLGISLAARGRLRGGTARLGQNECRSLELRGNQRSLAWPDAPSSPAVTCLPAKPVKLYGIILCRMPDGKKIFIFFVLSTSESGKRRSHAGFSVLSQEIIRNDAVTAGQTACTHVRFVRFPLSLDWRSIRNNALLRV